MLRILGIALFVFVASWFLITSVPRVAEHTNFVAVAPAAVGFVEPEGPWTGTLTYGKDNMQEAVPYLLFKNASGAIETKALVFSEDSMCDTSYGTFPCPLIENALPTYVHGMAVTVTGTVDAEHITVTRMVARASL